MAGFVPPVFALARQVRQVRVILNDNLEDQGVRNGRTFMDLLGRSATEQGHA